MPSRFVLPADAAVTAKVKTGEEDCCSSFI